MAVNPILRLTVDSPDLLAIIKQEGKYDPSRHDTSFLERELDPHVYALYGLMPEEIAIVDGTAP
jgi:hypothetical protein